MLKKLAVATGAISFAFFVLILTVVRTSQNIYSFQAPRNVLGMATQGSEIQYYFKYPGKILPDSSLWPLKALRDRVWVIATNNSQKKAELLLLLADKRLVSARMLFEKGKSEIAFSTLTKAEKYLEESHQQTIATRKKGIDTLPFEQVLVLASLKHLEVMENLLPMVPEDGQPGVIKIMDYPRGVYQEVSNYLIEKGILPPLNTL